MKQMIENVRCNKYREDQKVMQNRKEYKLGSNYLISHYMILNKKKKNNYKNI